MAATWLACQLFAGRAAFLLIGATLARWAEIDAFQQAHWKTRPWLRDVAATTRARLAAMTPGSSL